MSSPLIFPANLALTRNRKQDPADSGRTGSSSIDVVTVVVELKGRRGRGVKYEIEEKVFTVLSYLSSECFPGLAHCSNIINVCIYDDPIRIQGHDMKNTPSKKQSSQANFTYSRYTIFSFYCPKRVVRYAVQLAFVYFIVLRTFLHPIFRRILVNKLKL